MKYATCTIPVIGSALAIPAAILMAATIQPVPSSGLTVHEWGTFTSVAGEDGSAVDWNALGCSSDLPKFVNDFGYRGLKSILRGNIRMETPVMYFYSPRELEAHVTVSFPHGNITEWYPQGELGPSGNPGPATIEWRNIKVQPDASPAFPVEQDANRYYAARETDAAPLAVGDQHEKFLFYRGVGRFPAPLSATVASDGRIAVENRGAETVPNVILFENRGGRLGYRNAGAVLGATTLDAVSLDGSLPVLDQELVSALVAQGLFLKEAEAMVETWRDSWFEEGSRLIYILPQPAVDKLLPLKVEPAPSGTVRVFVGRIELITPATTRALESAIAKSDWSTVARYGRFLDPILTRIYHGDGYAVNQARRLYQISQTGSGACR